MTTVYIRIPHKPASKFSSVQAHATRAFMKEHAGKYSEAMSMGRTKTESVTDKLCVSIYEFRYA